MKKTTAFLMILVLGASLHGQEVSYDPYQHMDKAMTTLTGWSVGSMVVGTGMLFVPNTQVKYAGIQNIAWGAIDLGIAIWGNHTIKKDIGYKPPEQKRKEFQTALWINGLLDVLYIGAGYYLYTKGKNDKLKGTGAGIMVQGSFLFVFDWVNYVLTL